MQTAQLSLTPKWGVILLLWLGFHAAFSQGKQTPVPKEVRTNLDGSLYVRYGYQEYLPIDYNTHPDTKWPLIIHMVGVGERGDGSVQQLDTIAGIGISKLVENGQDYPFLIMSPQPTGNRKIQVPKPGSGGAFVPDTLGVFIDYILENYNVDPNRVYITAFSAAGVEAAKYISKNTEKIAAFMPIAGNVRSYFFSKTFCNLSDIPVWAFHNQYDPRLDLSGSKGFVSDLKQCTPAPIVRPKLTVYPGNTHDAWTKTYNGKGMGTEIVNPDYDAFDISVFDWFLKYSKDQAVIADAGTDQYLTLPTDSVTLQGVGRPVTGITYQWAQIGSTPGTATLSGQNTATLTARNLVSGTYEFELSVTDAQNNTDRDTVRVIVKSFVAEAGNNITVTLPVESVQLSGQLMTDGAGPGQTFTYRWRQVDGPDSLLSDGITIIDKQTVIADSTVATTSVSGFEAGVYRFEFEITDNSGAVARDYVQVTVKNNNNSLVANAGNDTTVMLSTEKVIFRGSGSDDVNQIQGYSWAQISGKPLLTLINADSAVLEVTGLVKGVFAFELTVTNDNGGSATDTVQLTVVDPNAGLEAYAGEDTTVTLPLEQLQLAGSGSDPANEITAYAWTKISGPEATLTDADQPTLLVSDLLKGTYEFELTVTNSAEQQAKDTVAVLVLATNDSLLANAGEDMTVGLPQERVEIIGTGSDPYNKITSYQWQQLSGPEVTLADADQATLTVSNLQEGSYEFELTVTNDNEGVAKDTVVLTVCQAPAFETIEDITTTLDQMPLEVPLTISDVDLSAATITATSDNQTFIADEDIEVVVENGAAKLLINARTVDSAIITVTVEENCVASQEFMVTASAVTAIEDEVEKMLMVYPNPSDGIFIVKWQEPLPKGTEVSIYSTQGALVQHMNVDRSQHSLWIDLSGSPTGTYLMLMRTKGQTKSYRLVKQ